MTKKVLEILRANSKGFVVFDENGIWKSVNITTSKPKNMQESEYRKKLNKLETEDQIRPYDDDFDWFLVRM